MRYFQSPGAMEQGCHQRWCQPFTGDNPISPSHRSQPGSEAQPLKPVPESQPLRQEQARLTMYLKTGLCSNISELRPTRVLIPFAYLDLHPAFVSV